MKYGVYLNNNVDNELIKIINMIQMIIQLTAFIKIMCDNDDARNNYVNNSSDN